MAPRWLARLCLSGLSGIGAGGLLPVELGRFRHRRAGDPDRARERRAEQEGDAPAPASQAGLVEQSDGERANADREQGADLAGGRGQRSDEAAAMGGRAFEQISDDAGIFAADREAGHAAQEEQQHAGHRPDLREGRQQGGRQHGRRHQRHRQEQHVPPAVAVADVTKEYRAQRPHQISEGEAAQRRQQRQAAFAEEDAAEHGDEIEVEGEVVPFDDGRESGDAQRAARNPADRRIRAAGWLGHGSFASNAR